MLRDIPALRSLIFIATFAALVVVPVLAISVLPAALHAAGVVAPHGWEEVILESLKSFG